MSAEFTEEEKLFLKNILGSISIKVSDPEASKTVGIVQGIIGKL